MQLFQNLMTISDESGLGQVADEAAIPTRVLLCRLLSAQGYCYCAGHCQFSDSLLLRTSLSAQ